MRDIGIQVTRAGSHTLRHACVQHLVEADMPFKVIGDYVGHRHPSSTLVYGKVAVHKLRLSSSTGGRAMTAHWNGYHSALATHIEQYLRAKRAMGCKFACEGRQLRLLDRFLAERGVDRIDVIDGACLQAFLDSRHRTNPRSYNNLLGDIRRLFDWIVGQQLLSASPLAAQAKPQRAQRIPFLFSPEVIRRLLVLAEPAG